MMSFLAPALLLALPLAALPVIIHLIHLHRRRTIPWAAMMFLLTAQQMNRGYSRLRQMLILTLRVLAVLGLIFLVSRPLAGGWLGLTGGAPDAILVLLDRSASMEQQDLATGQSKRSTALQKMVQGIEEMFGGRTRVVLIDSASNEAIALENPKALLDLPATQATDTTADLPAMLQSALDYVSKNQLGRTDIWIASDLRQADWNAASGRWEALRAAFAKMEAVRFHLIAYSQPATDDFRVTVTSASRRETPDRAELMLDMTVHRSGEAKQPVDLPVQVVVNGARSTLKLTVADSQLALQSHVVPIDKGTKRGWGRVELPADANARDNKSHFVFDQPTAPKSVIVSEDEESIIPLRAVLSSPVDSRVKPKVDVLPTTRATEIDWTAAALIAWHAPLPAPDEPLAKQLESFVNSGRSIVFFPTLGSPGASQLLGLGWGAWKKTAKEGEPEGIEWWRTSDDLFAHSRGAALPMGDLEVLQHCLIEGDGSPLARMAGGDAVMVRAHQESGGGGAWFCGILPGASHSSLARDGVVWYILLQRALAAGSKSLGNAQQRDAGVKALPSGENWKSVEENRSYDPLQAGVATNGERFIAINRPAAEDSPLILSNETLADLFAGLQFQRVDDSVENKSALANEIWRTFLLLMALALIGEAALCLPSRYDAVKAEKREEVTA